jgi:SAM-dependent methyltransferase
MPTITRRLPAHDSMPAGADSAALKQRAYRPGRSTASVARCKSKSAGRARDFFWQCGSEHRNAPAAAAMGVQSDSVQSASFLAFQRALEKGQGRYLVLDCFCGSGTTSAVAEKLGRRWIGCDLGRFAIHTTRKRLLSISNVRPFVVQNLGKYERQVWAGAEFGEDSGAQGSARQRAYVEFILKLASATPLHGYMWLDDEQPLPSTKAHGAVERIENKS